MRFRYGFVALLSLFLAFAIPSAARADGLDVFTLTLNNYDFTTFTVVETFTLPSTAQPFVVNQYSRPGATSFTFANVIDVSGPYTIIDGSSSDYETFYNSTYQADYGPSCSFYNSLAGCLVNIPSGDQQYFTLNGDGSLTFLPGTYQIAVFYHDPTAETIDSLVIVSETPEPSSLALLGTGIAGALGAARRRKA